MGEDYPVIVIGAGPTGLAAAAELHERGLTALVVEGGSSVGAAVREWGHVRLFSMWRDLVAPAAARLLAAGGWEPPAPEAHPLGREWVETYLVPLAAALDRTAPGTLRLDTRVTGVTRRGRDRVVDAGREGQPFVVHTRTADGTQERLLGRAVIDASGTWSRPGPLGGDGLPALVEETLRDRLSYRVPDVTTATTRTRYASRHTAVVGRGHSALTALVALSGLVESASDTRITWVLRRNEIGDAFGGGAADQLAARGALGARVRDLVRSGRVAVVSAGIHQVETGLVLVDDTGRALDPVDEVLGLTGFRPDLDFLSEIRLDLDPVLRAPTRLAPLIDPNVHSCGTVYPHGATELAHPEPGFYLAGMKSYGRAPTFLALTGFEQVRSIVALLAGDTTGAERVELSLPETGLCGGSGLFDAEPEADGEGCCATTPDTASPAGASASRP